MSDYNAPNNKPRPEKVVTGTARVKKKSKFREFLGMFVANDAGDVADYILRDVIVPKAKEMIENTVDGATRAILYGKEAKRPSSRSGATYVKYNRTNTVTDNKARLPSAHAFDEVIVDTREEARNVLERMDDIIATYSVASVADLYDLAGMETQFTDNKYGWTDIRGAQIVSMRDGGFLIKMPRAYPID